MAAIGQGLLLAGAVIAAAAAVFACAPRRGGAAIVALAIAATCLLSATVVLVVALVQHDFSLVYVADTSRRAMSAPYRAAAIWGGMEGSLLFWTALLASVSTASLVRSHRQAHDRDEHHDEDDREPSTAPITIGILAALTSAFATITLVTANPFRTLQIPATDGAGLVPILEHPAMLYHPPLLYLGLVSLTPPFAFTVAALARRTLDDRWRARCRRAMFVPWVLLAVGMVAGANWAYVELGWGGYWAWDPIENTALLPWLAVTAFLHQSVRRQGEPASEPASSDKSASDRPDLVGAALVLVAFVVAILGTLLTRSGAASSVHAFAQATDVGRALLALIVVLAVSCLAVFGRAAGAARASAARRGPASSAWTRRDGLLRVHVAIVTAALVLILAGTLSPVVRNLFGGEVTAIDGSYFATMTAPLVWIGLAIMAIAPARPAGASLEQILVVPVLVGLAVAAVLAVFGWTSLVTLLTGGLAGLAGSAALMHGWRSWRETTRRAARRRAAVAPHVAHLGFAILLLGVAGSTASQSSTVLLGRGDTTTIDGVEIRNDGIRVDDPDGDEPRIVVTVDVRRGGRSRVLEPGITGYRVLGQRLAETALWSDPTGDVQVALRDAHDNGNALLEIHTRPLAPLVWWGGIVLVIGGLLAATTRADRPRPRTDQSERQQTNP